MRIALSNFSGYLLLGAVSPCDVRRYVAVLAVFGFRSVVVSQGGSDLLPCAVSPRNVGRYVVVLVVGDWNVVDGGNRILSWEQTGGVRIFIEVDA